jgi:biotin transport system substrate-specific component
MTSATSNTSTLSLARPLGLFAALAVAGALLVALAAQAAVPIPGTPVPMTLQPMAVLIVGGLLGPGAGAASLALYLGMGAAGLPVFTPQGLPGVARLFGPTGGYLLAYPFAAALTGALASSGSWRMVTLAALAGMVTIHVGGNAQLLVLTGSPSATLAAGAIPFLAGDLLKVAVAVLVLRRFVPRARALR